MVKHRGTKWYLEKSIRIHGDEYDYSDTIYNGSEYPVDIICKKHGKFTLKMATDHIKGHAYGCPQCPRKYKGRVKSDTRLYYTWRSMRNRCNTPSWKLYEYYGGRGIKVQESWDKSFDEFEKYVSTLDNFGLFLNSNYSIDRIDNNKDYEEGNIRWVSKQDQVLNRKVTKSATGYRGIKKVSKNRYSARVFINKIELYVGCYEHIRDAVEARNKYIKDNNLPNLTQEYEE